MRMHLNQILKTYKKSISPEECAWYSFGRSFIVEEEVFFMQSSRGGGEEADTPE